MMMKINVDQNVILRSLLEGLDRVRRIATIHSLYKSARIIKGFDSISYLILTFHYKIARIVGCKSLQFLSYLGGG